MGALASRLETNSIGGRQPAESSCPVIEYAVIEEDGVFVTNCPLFPEILLAHEDINVINAQMPAAIREVIKLKLNVDARISRAKPWVTDGNRRRFRCQIQDGSPEDSA